MMLIALLIGLALAEVPPPSYEAHLGLLAWAEVDALLQRGDNRAAIARCKAIATQVAPTAGLHYLAAVAYRRLNRDDLALPELFASVALDSEYASPWFELGEIALIDGNWPDAERAYRQVSRLVTSGPHNSVGPLRLAEIAAHQQRVNDFEEYLRQALQRGFDLQDIAHEPQWRTFYADPAMRDSLTKMVTVYGDPALLSVLDVPL